MERELVREACLALPGATESVQWGSDIVFKVGGKMFAVVGESAADGLSFKCSPEMFYELQERSGVRPAPYLARAQWLLVEEGAAVAWPELKKLLEQAHAIVFQKLPKTARAAAAGGAKTSKRSEVGPKKAKASRGAPAKKTKKAGPERPAKKPPSPQSRAKKRQ